MNISKRFKRGFARIAFVGGVASSLAVGAFLIAGLMAFASTTVKLYVPGELRYIELPVSPTEEQVRQALDAGYSKLDMRIDF